MRHGVALARRARAEQELAHRRRHAHREGGDVVRHVLHDVVDRQAGTDGPARGVDVQADVAVRVLGGEQDELGADAVGEFVVDLVSEEDDPVPQQPLEDLLADQRAGRRFRDPGQNAAGSSARGGVLTVCPPRYFALSLSVTLTRSRGRLVRRSRLFALGAGMLPRGRPGRAGRPRRRRGGRATAARCPRASRTASTHQPPGRERPDARAALRPVPRGRRSLARSGESAGGGQRRGPGGVPDPGGGSPAAMPRTRRPRRRPGR